MPLEARRLELACTGGKCAGKVRPKSAVRSELSTLERLEGKLEKVLGESASLLPNPSQQP